MSGRSFEGTFHPKIKRTSPDELANCYLTFKGFSPNAPDTNSCWEAYDGTQHSCDSHQTEKRQKQDS